MKKKDKFELFGVAALTTALAAFVTMTIHELKAIRKLTEDEEDAEDEIAEDEVADEAEETSEQ